jgi:hypothetical protein
VPTLTLQAETLVKWYEFPTPYGDADLFCCILGCNTLKSCRWLSNFLRYFSCPRVGIATGYGLGDRGVGVRVPVGSRIFSTSSRPALGSTQPPIQWVPGALSLGIKRPGREADHSPPASAEVKKIWIYTSTPPYAFIA